MTHEALLHMLGITVVVCSSIVGFVDVGWQLDLELAIKMKWSLLWYAARYLGTICALLLAFDVLF